MKKLIFLAMFVFAGVMSYGQLAGGADTVYQGVTDINAVGTGIFGGGGDSKAVIITKTNAVFAIVDTLYSYYVTDTLTGGTPTDAEIDAALGVTPAQAQGKKYYIKDATGTGLLYEIMSDGTSWMYDSLKVAL